VVAVPLFCETCGKQVSAVHRVPEWAWLHRVIIALPKQREEPSSPNGKFSADGKGDMTMPNAKAMPKKVVKGKPPVARGKAPPVKETAAERRKRELAEERAMAKARGRK